MTCDQCGRPSPKRRRGVCNACYMRHKRRRTIDQLPPARTPNGRAWRATYQPDDIDHAVVVRILGGDWTMPSTPSEKAEVCRKWAAAGRPLNQLAQHTGWNVSRYYTIRGAA